MLDRRISTPARVLAFAALVAAGCDSVSVTSPGVAQLRVEPASLQLVTGQSRTLDALALNADGGQVAAQGTQWSSSSPTIVQVASDGTVTALAPGLASITATLGGVVGTAAVAVSVPGVLAISTPSVDFQVLAGAPPPPAQNVQIGLAGDGAAMDLTASVSYTGTAGWLNASLSGSSAPTSLRLQPQPSALQPGAYRAQVTVASPSASNGSVVVDVLLTVVSTTAVIAVNPDSLYFDAPGNQSVGIANGGGGTLTGLTTAVEYTSGQPTGWLSVALGSSDAPTAFVAGVDDSQLAAGRYTALIRVSSSLSGVSDVTIPVVLDGGGPAPSLRIAPDTLRLTATAGGAASGTLSIQNGGTGTVSGITRAVSYASGQPSGWLQTSLSGTVAPATLTATADASSLSPGSYLASIEFVANATNSPRFVPVQLTVSTASNPIPAAPTSLSATALDSVTVQVDWTDASTNETTFELERGVAGAAFAALTSTGADVFQYLDAGLMSSTAYSYRVRACNAAGCSAWSPTGSVTTPAPAPGIPTAPSGLAASAADTATVDLTWTNASSTETSFEVERATGAGPFAPAQTLPANSTGWQDTGLTPATDYRYRVRACNATGCSGWSAEASVTTPAPAPPVPAVPTQVSATALDSVTVDVAWTDTSSVETGFELERRAGAGAFAPLATTGADVVQYQDGGLTSATDYGYRVRACNGSGCSAWSAEASVTTPAPMSAAPAVPTGVTATTLSAIDVDVTWTDASTTETHFEVRRFASTGGPSAAGQTSANVATLRDTNLSPGTDYRWEVRACNGNACSAWSASASATTQNPTTVPVTPGRLRVVSASPQAVVLAWNDRSSNETRVEIEEGGPTVSWTLIGTVGVDVTTFTDTNVITGQTIQYRVRACNPVGCTGTTFVTLQVP